MAVKDPDYMMLMVSTYGMLEHSEGSETHQRHKGSGEELVTKQFSYHEVFGNHFNYRHQADDNKNCRHYPISVERTWATNY